MTNTAFPGHAGPSRTHARWRLLARIVEELDP
jgi:hypothetical protein